MGLTKLLGDEYGLSRCSQETAQSAARIIQFHHTYVTAEPGYEKPIQNLYSRELRLMVRRCLKLAFYLLTRRKKPLDHQDRTAEHSW